MNHTGEAATTDAKEKIIKEAIEVVKLQVKLYVSTHNLPPFIQPDDLLQEALVRMLGCIQRYDVGKGKLNAFLSLQTTGAIKDFLRKCDGYSKHRDKTVVLQSLTVPVNGSTELRTIDVPDRRVNVEADCMADGLLNVIKFASDRCLFDRYRLMLYLYYFEGKRMREISEIFGVNSSRISQIHRKALEKLRVALNLMGITSMKQLTD